MATLPLEDSVEFSDLHFTLSLTQGNVHSLSVLHLSSGLNGILFASLKKKVCFITFSESCEKILKPHVKDLSFSNIPSEYCRLLQDNLSRLNFKD